MMKNSKYNLVPYEVIERAITDDTAALLAVQERHKAYIGRLSGGNADMKERLNAKLSEQAPNANRHSPTNDSFKYRFLNILFID